MLLTTSEAPTDGLLAALTVYLCFLGLVRIATRVTGPGRSIALFSAWLALTAAAAFRHVEPTLGGRDAFIYRLVFESSQGAEGEPISVTGTGAASEPLYIGLVRLLRLFTDDYHVYFFVVYGIISFGIVYFISKTLEARHSVLPLILIFPAWLHSFNIMRNWIAIAFFLVALTFLIRGRRPAYYALVLVATGFHLSAAVMLLFPLAAALLFGRRRPQWTLIGIIVMNGLLLFVSDFVSRIVEGTRYEGYLNLDPTSPLYVLPLVAMAIIGLVCVAPAGAAQPGSKELTQLLLFAIGLMTIILLYGGYRYLSYMIAPQAVVAAWALHQVKLRHPLLNLDRLIWTSAIYAVIAVGTLTNLQSVIELSGVFPYLWTL